MRDNQKKIIIIGYSGHAFVALDIAVRSGWYLAGYCDVVKKEKNPYSLTYLGRESNYFDSDLWMANYWFIGVGDNAIRSKIFCKMVATKANNIATLVHDRACVSEIDTKIGVGTMVCSYASINPCVSIGNGSIINTHAVIEHECWLGDFTHVGPNATLCGNVIVEEGAFVGAGAVVLQGLTIGAYATVGAGSVVTKDVKPHEVVIGVPSKSMIK